MVRSKNKASDTLGQRLALVVKSGRISMGYKTTMKSLRTGKAKLVLIAANMPALRKSEIECTLNLMLNMPFHIVTLKAEDYLLT